MGIEGIETPRYHAPKDSKNIQSKYLLITSLLFFISTIMITASLSSNSRGGQLAPTSIPTPYAGGGYSDTITPTEAVPIATVTEKIKLQESAVVAVPTATTEPPVVPVVPVTKDTLVPTSVPVSTPVPAGSKVEISYIFYDGVVRVESDEYVQVKNSGGTSQDMSLWRINAGSDGQDFFFPNGFSLSAGQSCKVYTNEVHNDSCAGSSFGSGEPLWNNNGDTGTLFNKQGSVVDTYSY